MNYHIVNQYLAPYLKQSGEPFLKHVDYFTQGGPASMPTIVNQWHRLKEENKLKLHAKAALMCPHVKMTYQFGTTIVNQNGSINMAALKDIMKTCFKKHDRLYTYCMTKSDLFDYLSLCQLRWEMMHHDTTPWYQMSQHTMAKIKWYEFFNYFTDYIIDGQQAVSIETLLQFYFEPDVLYQRVIFGELPV